jgi:hypothetical protein
MRSYYSLTLPHSAHLESTDAARKCGKNRLHLMSGELTFCGDQVKAAIFRALAQTAVHVG